MTCCGAWRNDNRISRAAWRITKSRPSGRLSFLRCRPSAPAGCLLRQTVGPGIVRQYGIDEPAAEEGHCAFGHADIGFARCERAIENNGRHHWINDHAAERGHAVSGTDADMAHRRIAVLLCHDIASCGGRASDADTNPGQPRILAMIDPGPKIIPSIALSTCWPGLQPDRNDQGQPGEKKSPHSESPSISPAQNDGVRRRSRYG